jgi:6-phosphogluconolactonase
MLRRNLMAGMCLLAAFTSLPVLAYDRGATINDREDNRGENGRFVYTMTNAIAGNSVMVFRQASDGSLSPVGPVSTGGNGTGAGLGSQGALTSSRSNRWLLAVNAGSNDVSVFKVSDRGLTLASTTPSGGSMPISVTISGRTVYVLNAGTPNNITGFTLGKDGSLTPIANSTRALSTPAAGPAQVQFNNDGDMLVVTEKGTNLIDVFPVSHDLPGALVTSPSHGITPFGFTFGKRDRLFVTEAFGGAPDISALSSYDISDSNALQVISGSVSDGQTAACWVVIGASGKFAYVSNTGSKNVSVFRIGKDGNVTALASLGPTPAGGAIDSAFSSGGTFLHVLTGNAATIVTFRVKSDGTLQTVGTVSAPPTAAGLAAE